MEGLAWRQEIPSVKEGVGVEEKRERERGGKHMSDFRISI